MNTIFRVVSASVSKPPLFVHCPNAIMSDVAPLALDFRAVWRPWKTHLRVFMGAPSFCISNYTTYLCQRECLTRRLFYSCRYRTELAAFYCLSFVAASIGWRVKWNTRLTFNEAAIACVSIRHYLCKISTLPRKIFLIADSFVRRQPTSLCLPTPTITNAAPANSQRVKWLTLWPLSFTLREVRRGCRSTRVKKPPASQVSCWKLFVGAVKLTSLRLADTLWQFSCWKPLQSKWS